jgi:hypothetical protein
MQSKYEEFRKRYKELKELSTSKNSRRKLTFKQNKVLQFTADRGSTSTCFASLDNISCIIPSFQVLFVQEYN